MSSEEIVNSRAAIIECIEEMAKSGSLLQLACCDGDDDNVYESRIQSVASDKNLIILHQVLPGDWRDTITPTRKLEIRSRTHLGNIRFRGFLSPLDDSEKNIYCRLTLPKIIYRIQLRDSFRVSLAKTITTASVQINDDKTCVGKCKDISMAGVLLLLSADTGDLEIGKTVDHCSISISGILDLDFRGKICSLKRTEKEILAGIQFLDLAQKHMKPISLALNKIERQNINT